jgi:drug/metabolite transporter (DMT)-like permease
MANATLNLVGEGLQVEGTAEAARLPEAPKALETSEAPEAPSAGGGDAVRKRALIGAALLAVYVIWGSTYLGMHIALEGFPPFMMGGIRFLLAGAILYTALRLRGAPRPALREWRSAAVTGVLLLAGGNGLVAVGQQWVSTSVAAVVVATMPLWMALLGTFQGQRPSRGEWTGLLIGFAGVGLLNMGGELSAVNAAALVILLAPICWALGSVWSRSLSMPAGAMSTATQMLAGGVSMVAISSLRGESFVSAPPLRSVLALAYLIVFGSIVAFSAYGFLLRNTRPAIATSYAYVNPVVAIALGIALGGEKVELMTIAAVIVILGGVLVLSRAKIQRQVEAQAVGQVQGVAPGQR